MCTAGEVATLLKEAKSCAKKCSKFFRNRAIGSQMETTDINATTTLQLKTFQMEYQAIQKKTQRIKKQRNLTIKQDYIYRQNRDYTILHNKIQHWLNHHKSDVVNAIDIVINNYMLNHRPRPFRCKPPVCDQHNRYYFGRTVGHQKTLAIRSNLDGTFLIQGWLKYDPYSGASIEQFDSFVAYTENNVASFITDITVNDKGNLLQEPFATTADETNAKDTYSNQIMSTALIPYNANATIIDETEADEISEEQEYKMVLFQQKEYDASYDDDEEEAETQTQTNEKDTDNEIDKFHSNSTAMMCGDDVSISEGTLQKKTFPPTIRELSYIEQQGLYIHHAGLKQHLEECFPHATIDVSKLIQSKFNRRKRLYTLKENTYKKLTTITTTDDAATLKVHSDTLRKLLLKLWKDKLYVCTPNEYASLSLNVQKEYEHVLDGCV